MQLQSLPSALRRFQNNRTYSELVGNIFIINEQNQISSFSNRPFEGNGEGGRYSWTHSIVDFFEKVVRFAESYQKPILLALGVSIFIVTGKLFFASRKK